MSPFSAGAEPTRVVLVRHGRTAWNAATRIQGQIDIPLDDEGLRQAERLAEALAPDPPDVIYSSDLLRAQQTAQPLAERLALPVRTDAGLRERAFGVFEGQTFAEVQARWPEQAQRWRQRDEAFAPDGGETLRDFFERVVGAVRRLILAHPGAAVLLVAHGGVLDCLHRAALGLPLNAPRSWALGNATINRLLFSDEGFTVVGWNDDAHL